MTITVHRLDTDEQVPMQKILVGVCMAVVRALESRLEFRRLNVVVRAANGKRLRERGFFQAITVGALYERALRQYPPEVRAEIEEHALALADQIGREG